MKPTYLTLLCIGSLMLMMSCSSNQIFRTSQKGDLANLITADTALHQPIKSDDKISVSVWDNNDLSFGSVFNIYNSNESFGKWILVDADGYVVMPKLGRVLIKGLTCPEAADMLAKLYGKFLLNPIVVVKVLNKEISILGDVVRPGTYTLDQEVYTITEIIAKAQGLDQFANPKKIQLIRNDTNYRVNLAQLSSDKAYRIVVQPDDIIYVPSKWVKPLAENSPILIPFATVLTSVAVFSSILK